MGDCSVNLGGDTTNMGFMEDCAGGNEEAKTSFGGGHLCHDSGISLDWTPQEQSVLEDLLTRYAKDTIEVQYNKIANALPDKTTRDVAFRCIWMRKKEFLKQEKKEIGKQRKDDWNSSGMNKEKKEYVTDPLPSSSQVTNGNNSMMMDCDDKILYKMIGGVFGKLLEQNDQAFNQISAKFSDSKMHECPRLFYQAQFNILSIINECRNISEKMKQMPPLPAQLNEKLATTIFPQISSYMPEMEQMHYQAK